MLNKPDIRPRDAESQPAAALKKFLSKQSNIEPYLLILPAFVFVMLVYFFPIYKVVADSLFDMGAGGDFVGLSNYRYIILDDDLFRIALTNNVRLMLGVPVLVWLALLLAYLIYTQMRGWQVFRFVFVVPYILSITAIGITFDYILRENGLLNELLTGVGLDGLSRNWLGDVNVAIYAVLGVVIWKEFGFGVILFLARMMSIDRQVIEAAVVDGASSLQTFWYVILPEMTSAILFYVTINVINLLSWMFNYVFVMTRGGPMNSTYVMEYYIYQTGIRYRQYGISSALAAITLLVAVVFVVIQLIARRRLVNVREAT